MSPRAQRERLTRLIQRRVDTFEDWTTSDVRGARGELRVWRVRTDPPEFGRCGRRGRGRVPAFVLGRFARLLRLIAAERVLAGDNLSGMVPYCTQEWRMET